MDLPDRLKDYLKFLAASIIAGFVVIGAETLLGVSQGLSLSALESTDLTIGALLAIGNAVHYLLLWKFGVDPGEED